MLQQGVPAAGLDQVAFYGGSFTALPDELQVSYLQTVQPFIKSRQISGVRISTRPDRLTAKSVRLLRDYGVETVELGCQSFSDDVLLASGRGCRAENHAVAVRLLRSAGFSVGIQLMPGLPGGGDLEARDSLRQALALRPDFLRIYPTLVLAGTRLEVDWRDGRYRPLSLAAAVDLCAVMALDCYRAGVPVLRFGLQASSALDAAAVLDGPYHPAFGQMVRSSLWRRALIRLATERRDVVILVHPHDLSDVLGQKRANTDLLAKAAPGLVLEASGAVDRGCLRVNQSTIDMMAFVAGNGDVN